jgi:hypothetical protein
MQYEIGQTARYADMFAASEAAVASEADAQVLCTPTTALHPVHTLLTCCTLQVAPECRLTLKAFERDATGKQKLVATSLSWNATGQTIAVAYGR